MQLSSVPSQIVKAWATGDSSKTNPIPVPSQTGITPGAASLTDGFPPLCATPVASGGIPPSKADMNGILYQMSAVDVWMCAGGGFPYNSAFSSAIGGYPNGARVLMARGNGYWVSTVDNNVTDPDTGGAGWASDDSNAITSLTGDVTAAGPGAAVATLAASGVTAGSYTGATITVDAKGRVTAAASGSTKGYDSAANIYWEKSSTGKITQWQNQITLTGSSTDVPVTFSTVTPFTNTASINISLTSQKNGSTPEGVLVIGSGTPITTSGFAVHQETNTSQIMNWVATGY